MKRLLLLTILLASFFTYGQCTYDESCTISPAFPTICPIQLPNATVGESYNTDLTFWMPVAFEAEGFEVTLTALTVTQITGLPIGLSVELSNESMVFYPSQNEFGCANVNGVPFASGDYVITVYVVADVTVASVGFDIAYPTQFDLYLTVNPGSGGNTSFTYSPSNGCEDLDVTFEALITSDEYDVEYNWDFGNGSTSNDQYPETQVYDEPGDYDVTLVTNLTASNIELNSFNIDWVSDDCYGGDFEEYCWDLWLIGSGCWSDPDLFLKIYDANSNLIYQTGGIGSGEYITGTSASWSNINLTLNNPPYTVEIWDTEAWDILDGLEDMLGIPLDVQVSDDDLLGSYVLNLEDGQHSFSSGCSNGTYSIVSSETPLDAISATETISVFEQPDLETLFDEELYIVYVDYTNALSYQWFLDGEAIPGADSSMYDVLESGTYYVEFVTVNGCSGISFPIDVIVNLVHLLFQAR
jgi:PKD repeat protein